MLDGDVRCGHRQHFWSLVNTAPRFRCHVFSCATLLNYETVETVSWLPEFRFYLMDLCAFPQNDAQISWLAVPQDAKRQYLIKSYPKVDLDANDGRDAPKWRVPSIVLKMKSLLKPALAKFHRLSTQLIHQVVIL